MKFIYWEKIRIYLKDFWQEYEEGCKSVLISKETEISRVH